MGLKKPKIVKDLNLVKEIEKWTKPRYLLSDGIQNGALGSLTPYGTGTPLSLAP